MKCVNCKQTAENMKEAKSVLDPPSGWVDLMWKLGAYWFWMVGYGFFGFYAKLCKSTSLLDY